MPTFGACRESLHRDLYDTESLATDWTDFFERPIGVGRKTTTDTSMRLSAVLPCPERFTLKARPEVALFKDSKLLTVFENEIWSRSNLTFHVNSKQYIQGPLWTFAHPICAIGGLEKFLELKQSERDEFFRLRVLAIDIRINSGATVEDSDPFGASIQTEFPDKNIKAYIGLPGIYDRAI